MPEALFFARTEILKGLELMKIFFIVVAAVFAVLAIIFLLLLGKASVNVVCEDEVEVFVRFLFFKLKIFPPKEKKKKRKHGNSEGDDKNRQESEDDKSKDDDVPAKKESNEKKSSVKETVELIFAVVKRLFKIIGKHGEIYVKKVLITISCEEACDTAVRSGLMYSVLGAGLAVCGLFDKSEIEEKNVGVIPDFVGGKNGVSADITVGVRAIYLVFGLIGVLWDKIKPE